MSSLESESPGFFPAHPIAEEAAPLDGEAFAKSDVSQSLDWRSYNHLKDLQELRNRYVCIRHGKSEANEKGIHSGDQDIASDRYPLVQKGVEQVENSIKQAIAQGLIDENTIILCSDFLRVKQSAKLAAHELNLSTVYIEKRLGERGAGELEGRSIDAHKKLSTLKEIIHRDMSDPFHTTLELESPVAVLDRVTSVIRELEEKYQGKTFLIVSHHDTLQILRAACKDMPPGEYHDFPRLKNAAVFELTLSRQ